MAITAYEGDPSAINLYRSRGPNGVPLDPFWSEERKADRATRKAMRDRSIGYEATRTLQIVNPLLVEPDICAGCPLAEISHGVTLRLIRRDNGGSIGISRVFGEEFLQQPHRGRYDALGS